MPAFCAIGDGEEAGGSRSPEFVEAVAIGCIEPSIESLKGQRLGGLPINFGVIAALFTAARIIVGGVHEINRIKDEAVDFVFKVGRVAL